MKFYLGTHKTNWLTQVNVPLFISHRQARTKKKPLQATTTWALDSGGYTELSTYGEWRTGLSEYVDAVARYTEWGGLEWAAQQDWMTEPWVLEKTGKSVQEHHELTVQNYLDLSATGLPFKASLQGPNLDDYLRHFEMFASAGVDLTTHDLVCVGSVCRRAGTAEAEEICRELAALGLKLHGFGVKVTGLRRYADVLASSDSLAWSFRARRAAGDMLATGKVYRCPWGAGHKNCANCLPFALQWREKVLDSFDLDRGVLLLDAA